MKKSALILTAALLLAACNSTKQPPKPATPQPAAPQQPQSIPPFGFMKDVQGAQQVGKGNTGYRFVLFEPNTTRMAANKPFVLAHRAGRLPFANGADGMYFGTTDANGLTPVFVFESPVPEDGFILLERIGRGNSGTWLNLNDNGRPLSGVAYTLNVCAAKPYQYHGVTNTRGQTVYVAADKGTKMHITPYTNDAAAQQATLARLCPAVKSVHKKAAKRRP
ncbi:MAG: hypothetical protein Q4A84_10345 [Neisseria sp.]|uniref:hypothetical protein n=1 Tax=Neisseria sp. TaxID=192066 RepID=UPI0026DB92ED|nr:hypothetical protein [Neisseria sp.]MDO4642076.1 hypothetical protein [Neisseria sp.]